MRLEAGPGAALLLSAPASAARVGLASARGAAQLRGCRSGLAGAAGLRYHERVDTVGTTRALRRLGYLPADADLERIAAHRGGMAAEARLAAAGNWSGEAAAYWAGVVRDCGGGVSTEDDSDSDDNWWDSPGDGAEADGGLQGRGRQVPSPSTVMSGDRLPAARAGTATATGVDAAP